MSQADSANNRIYQTPQLLTKDVALAALKGDDPDQIGSVLYSLALYEGDVKWVEDICLKFADDPSPRIRAVAVQSLGVLGRVHQEDVDYERIVAKIFQRIIDDDEVYSPYAEEAITEVLRFYWRTVPYGREKIIADLTCGSEVRAFVDLDGIGKCEPDVRFALEMAKKYANHENGLLRAGGLDLFAKLASKLSCEQIRESVNLVDRLGSDPVRWIREKSKFTHEFLMMYLSNGA